MEVFLLSPPMKTDITVLDVNDNPHVSFKEDPFISEILENLSLEKYSLFLQWTRTVGPMDS